MKRAQAKLSASAGGSDGRDALFQKIVARIEVTHIGHKKLPAKPPAPPPMELMLAIGGPHCNLYSPRLTPVIYSTCTFTLALTLTCRCAADGTADGTSDRTGHSSANAIVVETVVGTVAQTAVGTADDNGTTDDNPAQATLVPFRYNTTDESLGAVCKDCMIAYAYQQVGSSLWTHVMSSNLQDRCVEACKDLPGLPRRAKDSGHTRQVCPNDIRSKLDDARKRKVNSLRAHLIGLE